MKLILALNSREASQYAELVGLKAGSWRLATPQSAFAHSDEVIKLPGWSSRRDRFRVDNDLRYLEKAKRVNLTVVTVEELADLKRAAEPAPITHSDKVVGDQLDIYDVLGDAPTPRPKKRTAKKSTVPPARDEDPFI